MNAPRRSRRSAPPRSRAPTRRGRSRSRKPTHSDNPRIAAVRVLQAISAEHGSFRDRLPEALAGLATADRSRCRAWCYGLARFDLRLQFELDALLDKPLKARDADLAWLLKLGLHQLQSSDVPAPLIVSETVEATELLDKSWARGLVNAVLRRYLREREAGSLPVPPSTAVAQAMPDWIFERLTKDWGAEAGALAEISNQQAPMTLRLAAGADGLDQGLRRFEAAGLSVYPGQRAAAALRLETPLDVVDLPGFGDASVTVQDESAQLAVELLVESTPADGRLLDACCAPGGKTLHALDSGHFAELVALDVSAERLARVSESLQRRPEDARLSLQCADAAAPDTWWDGRAFDVILVDAPCSGSGVIRRHPDIKLLRSEADMTRLHETQAALLDALWQVLAPGGFLMYCTCSVFQSENEGQIARFFERCGDARLVPLPARAGRARPGEQQALGRQWLPTCAEHGDGFWYALLQRLPEVVA